MWASVSDSKVGGFFEFITLVCSERLPQQKKGAWLEVKSGGSFLRMGAING